MSDTTPRYPVIVLETNPDNADAMSGMLDFLGADAIEQRDASTLERAGTTGVTLRAGFPDEDGAREALAALEARGADARLEFVVGDAWRDLWKAHWKPTRCGRKIVVVPSWTTYTPEPGETILPLDPGYAFGTGQHPSTVMAACALENWLETHSAEHPRVIDIGCGSGILSLIAVMLGASDAIACDIDRESVVAARGNIRSMDMDERIEVRVGSVDCIRETARLVVANIECSVLVPLASMIAARLDVGGRLILSGILEVQRDEIVKAYTDIGLQLVQVEQQGDWICPEFTRR